MALSRVVIFSFRQFQFHIRIKSDYKPNNKFKMYVMPVCILIFAICRPFYIADNIHYSAPITYNRCWIQYFEPFQQANYKICLVVWKTCWSKHRLCFGQSLFTRKETYLFLITIPFGHRLITSVSLFKLSIQDVLLDKDIIITHLISSDISVFVIKLE